MLNSKSRKKQAILGGIVLIIANLAIGTLKITVGLISSSIAVMSDAINNVGDALSNAFLIAAFILAAREADKEHPQGHGRYEYISAMLFSFMIVFVGIEFLINAIKRLILPQQIIISNFVFIVMLASIIIKAGMCLYAYKKEKVLKSGVFKAIVVDSLTDIIISTAVIVSLILQKATSNFYIDAIIGAAVSIFIIFMGIKLLTQTVGKLVGKRADSQIIKKLWQLINSNEDVLGVHDLMIHDYGADKIYATAHIQLDSKISLANSHKIAQSIKEQAQNNLNICLLLYCEPIFAACNKTNNLLNQINRALISFEDSSAHDIEIEDSVIEMHITIPEKYETAKEDITNIISDVLLPYNYKIKNIFFDIIY